MKSKFPIFSNIPELVYLDNGATTQKPRQVINSIYEYYNNHNANVHRGLYPLSEKSTEIYNKARATVAEFINAQPEEVIFTSGTTDSINGAAESLKMSGILPKKPRILLTQLEHHSNILPWMRFPDAQITYAKIDGNYQVDLKTLEADKFDLIAITHVSNVTGTLMKDISSLANKNPGSIVLLDAAQSAAHYPIDVKELNVDFMAFSAHKMYGPMGTGVLYGKKGILKNLEPYRTGGGMLTSFSSKSTKWANIPEKFEAGTPNVAGALGLAEAIKFINEVGFAEIVNHENYLRNYLLDGLQSFKNIKVLHPAREIPSAGVISLLLEGIHAHDAADYLGSKNICVRAGYHCAQMLLKEVLEVPSTLRISFGIYNSETDVNLLLRALKEVAALYARNDLKKSTKASSECK